jgi:hypothetical protein
LGGEDIAYHDFDTLHMGGDFRNTEAVDILASDNRVAISEIVNGEWLEYSVDIQQAGEYFVQAICASEGSEGSFTIEIDGVGVRFEVPNTNNEFDTVDVHLIIRETGSKILRMTFHRSGLILDHLNFSLVNQSPFVSVSSPLYEQVFETADTIAIEAEASDVDGTVAKVEFYIDNQKINEDLSEPFSSSWIGVSGIHKIHVIAYDDVGLSTSSSSTQIIVNKSLIQKPFPDPLTPHTIPGKVEAEDFDSGEDGIAFHDLASGNVKGEYRTDVDPDIEICTDTGGGYNLADIQNGEWVEYQLNVAEAGNYDFTFRIATIMDGQKFSLSVDEEVMRTDITVPNTGGWQTWQTIVEKNIHFTEGLHVLRLSFGSEYFNLNYFDVALSAPVATETVFEPLVNIYPNPSSGRFYLLLDSASENLILFDSHGGLVYEKNCDDKLIQSVDHQFSNGVYFLRVEFKSGRSQNLRVVVKP